MCRDCTALLGEAEQLVALAEAERLVILAETEAGLSVPHAIRPLYEHEIRAGVRFGDIWETLEHADRQIVARIARAVEQLEKLIVMHIPAGTPRERATALLADMLTSPPPDVQTVLDDLTAQLTAVFAGTRRAGQKSVQVEAIFQGLALDLPDPSESTRDAEPALAAAAAGVAGLFFAQYISRLIPAVNRPDVTVKEALRVVAEPGWKGVQDQARQETHVQHSAGRSDAAALVDGEPALYASELMDGRTCVRAGTLVETGTGMRPIEQVREGELVRTHRGRFMPVVGTSAHDVDEPLVRLSWAGGAVELTYDHPVLVEREGRFAWVDAGCVKPGERVIERGTEAVRPDNLLTETAHREPHVRQLARLTGIHLGTAAMPVGAVNLDDQPVGDEEVHCPLAQAMLALIADAASVESVPDGALGSRDGHSSAVAVASAVEPLANQAGADTEPLPALVTGDEDRGTTALLRTVSPRRAPTVPEGVTAPLADRVNPGRVQAARAGAVRIPLGVADWHRKIIAAVRAVLRDAVARCAQLSLNFRARIDALTRAVGCSGSVTPSYLGAAGLAVSGGRPPGRARRIRSDLSHASVVVQKVERMGYVGRVHDLTVAVDHSFTAGGVVVHNCSPCKKIDGRRFASEEEAAEFYPNGGPMRYCLGGNRCRGTLVFDWSDAVEGDDGELPEIEDTPVVPPVPVPA